MEEAIAVPAENPYRPPQTQNLEASDDRQATDEAVPPYAKFRWRIAALLLDALVLFPVLGVVLWLIASAGLPAVKSWVVLGFISFLCVHIFVVKRYGGTPGMLILKMRITPASGAPLTWSVVWMRSFIPLLISLPANLALILGAQDLPELPFSFMAFFKQIGLAAEHAPKWNTAVTIISSIWGWADMLTMLCNRKRRSATDFVAGTVVLRRNGGAPPT